MRGLLLITLLLSACAASPTPHMTHSCPPATNTEVAIPARLLGRPTPQSVGQLQIRGELAREAERAGRLAEKSRADACTATVQELQTYLLKSK